MIGDASARMLSGRSAVGSVGSPSVLVDGTLGPHPTATTKGRIKAHFHWLTTTSASIRRYPEGGGGVNAKGRLGCARETVSDRGARGAAPLGRGDGLAPLRARGVLHPFVR